VLLGLGVVGIGTSVAMFVLQDSAANRFEMDHCMGEDRLICRDSAQAQSDLDTVRTFNTVGWVAVGVGAAAAVAGVALMVVGASGGRKEQARIHWMPTVALSPNGSSMEFGLRAPF
jgi:hypothetical protein